MIAAVVVLAILTGLLGGLCLALADDRRHWRTLTFERTDERDAARAELAGLASVRIAPGRLEYRSPRRWR